MGNRSLHLDADLDRVGTKLDPVVDQEGDTCEWPDRGKECQVAELHTHLAEVGVNIVEVEFGLVAHAGQEGCFFLRVVDFHSGFIAFALVLEFFGFAEEFALGEGDEGFESEADDLRGDGEVDYLFLESVGVDLEGFLGLQEPLVCAGEVACGDVEDVEVGDYVAPERDVDECGEEEGDVGADKVEDEDLLGHCCVVGTFGLIVFKLGELCGDTGKNRGEHRDESGEKAGWEEDKHRFERAVVDLREEDFDRKDGGVESG